jgi:hypothetical protein
MSSAVITLLTHPISLQHLVRAFLQMVMVSGDKIMLSLLAVNVRGHIASPASAEPSIPKLACNIGRNADW